MVTTRNHEKAKTSWNRHMRGTESLWYYGTENSRAIRFDAQTYFHVDFQVGGNVFVPVESVLMLGYSPLGSTFKLSNDDNDPDNGAPQPNQPKVTEWIDEELIEKTPTDWKMSEVSITQPREIPVRCEDGSTKKLHIKVNSHRKISDSWTTYVRKVLSLGSGKSFKPTRQCDMPLENPLLILPLQDRKDLIQSRFEMTMEEFFQDLISKANKSNHDNKSTIESDDGKWKLKFYDGWPLEHPGYKRMSVDPFHLYATYIHEDDWHSYMTMLGETETNPIRRFISFKDKDACNILNELMLKVGERDLMIQAELTLKERELLDLELTQMKDDKADAIAFRRRKIAKALQLNRRSGLDSQVKRYDFYYGQTTIEVALAEAKMAAASGKRASQPTQATVMGGISASDIASGLGWEQKRLSSGFFSSEWLHLAAFSWGGFMSPGEKSGFSTSQNLENLVFGTSETNSLMTRYEMAWQDFYRKEQNLHDKLAAARNKKAISVHGLLGIRCNDFSSEDPSSRLIRCDVYTPDNKYKFKDFTINKSLVEEVLVKAEENIKKDESQTMSDLYDRTRDNTPRHFQDSRTPDKSTSEAEMLLLAHDFPCVVYSIQYKIVNEFKSILLNDKACAHFSFFPFQRSLYHQAEAVLDALVWKEIKDKADTWVREKIDTLEGRRHEGRDDDIEFKPPSKRRQDPNNPGRRSTLFDQDRDEEMGQQQKKPKQKKNKVFNIIRYGGFIKPHRKTKKKAVEGGNQDQ